MLICDTGPLYASLNRKDDDHTRCLGLLEQHRGPLVVPSPVLAEVCWLLESRIGPDAEAAFLDSVSARELELAELSDDDVSRMADLVRRYRAFPLGAVDAAVITIAEHLEAMQIATLDHRHFRAVKPLHTDAFELLP
ncbi:MAG: type II toxin-antitoxin system VapC family toxin [Egibacteraceae bacterium]